MINSTQMEQMMEKISDFVEGICLETQHRGASPQRVLNSPNSVSHRSTPNRRIAEEREEKVEEVDQGRKLVIESEQFKAAVDPLAKGKGNGKQQENEIDLVKRNFVEDYDDDNYFHLICHVDQSLKNRIERGEYIELEKLLPKRKSHGSLDDSRLEWVTKDGMTFLTPVHDRDSQIKGVRHWEQAFRVYAAIFCNANPTRSGEIWQYIHTINTAASTYQWENLQYYDTVFRQMMSERPGRSWVKTYTQLWQLALKDHIQKTNGAAHVQSHFGVKPSGGSNGNAKPTEQKHRDWRDNCCWQFNRTGRCTRSLCNFDNRCSYCGMWNSHGSNTCRKKNKDAGGGSTTSVSASSSSTGSSRRK